MYRSKLAMVTLIALTVGCGHVNGLADGFGAGISAAAGQMPSRTAPGLRGPQRGGLFFFGADLNLTDDQKAQIQAIQAKYRPAPPDREAGPLAKDTLKQVLSAEVVNEEALRNALKNQQEAMASLKPPSHADQMAEIRAVLTKEQIDTVVAKLQAAPKRPAAPPRELPEPGEWANKRAEKLNLSDVQKTAFDAFQAKLKANRPAPPATDHHQAMLAFWQTGNQDALKFERPVRPDFPTEELVQLALVLDQSQRQAVFGRLHGRMGGMRGHHFGRPGFGPRGA